MFVRKQFLSFWKSHYNIVAVSFYSMILIVLEEIMEIEFKCPQKFSLKLGYIDCVASRNERNSKQNANQSTAAEFLSESYTISQIAGLAVLAVVSLLYGLYRVCHFWLCRNDEEHWKEELGSLLEKEVRKHIKEMKKEGAKQMMEEKVKPSLQGINTNFWKNIDYRNTAKKIKEVVESVITDTWVRQQAVKQGVPLMSCVDTTTTEPTSETRN
ncbi:uncharacterized protein LOC128901557 [Rissa tridactyla]|uniref:uncharacterized protein LOC128901557 n=1 Tax=Rissa tridactyla TaxID=75485 RepID=UPI0023BA6C9D|nr:uncharacterized protein LOC128901557 [Rissa tridactyla]